MSFLVLLGALLLTYYRPLPVKFAAGHWHRDFSRLMERNLNDGHARHGFIAWVLSALLPTLLIAVAYYLLWHFAVPLATLYGVVVLYLVLDFRGFSAPAEAIAKALRDNHIQDARERLELWSGQSAEAYGAGEISRVAIETTLMRSHYSLYAPIFWFMLLGPAGAVLYRLSQSVDAVWGGQDEPFNRVPRTIFYWLDWLPVRFTAVCFAVVGDFEDALYCWRTQAAAWKNEAVGIMLASGAGALGVRIGEPLPFKGILEYRPEMGLGDVADADYLMSTVGLIWRALVLMLALMLLLTFANWLGN
ncbi:adenosylcobinamide-phosphate synthase [Novimethylophilus kurashikiensis]|uniref:Cobalamin biosynthesis protein CobD n=1 Tax=Novimethylophilus kurashikiensis TaxID=1825523 RepID=A0A2R5F6J7_9PROT|nr:CobD/CbiB family protein [Novimethylophilus kurashikiensis]GBG13890.1 adenosylcobinamide-phosphate synthase [Novimethylophilus kurashikiensis]